MHRPFIDLQSNHRLRALVATNTLMAAALLVAVIAQAQTGGGGGGQSGGTSLTPQEVQEAEKTGTGLADAERQLETGEPILKDDKGNPLSKKDLEAKVKNAKDLEKKDSPVSDEYKKIVKKAYLKRKRTYLESDLKRAQGTGDEKAMRRAKRQLQELDDELKKVTASLGAGQALPEGSALASTGGGPSDVSAGLDGFVTLLKSATTTAGSSGSIDKGNMKYVGTAAIQQQIKTLVKYDDAAQIEVRGKKETPRFFYDGLSRMTKVERLMRGEPTWSALDEQPPFVATWNSPTSFTFDSIGNFVRRMEMTGIEQRDYSLKLNVASGYKYTSESRLNLTTLMDRNVTFNVTINKSPHFTVAFRPKGDFRPVYDIPGYLNNFTTLGTIDGTAYKWNTFYPRLIGDPFNALNQTAFIGNGLISEAGYLGLAWGPLKEVIAYGHPDPGAHPLPAPGLNPANWPTTEADAIPRVMIPAALLQE